MLELYKTLYNQRVFTLKDVIEIKKNIQVAKNSIQRLQKQKLIKRIKNGLYHIIPLDNQLYTPPPIMIASRLKKKYFLSHLTALQIHDLLETSIIYISCNQKKTLKIYNREYNLIKTKQHFGITEMTVGNQKVKVSDPERTFLDCLQIHHQLFPNLNDFIRIMQAANLDIPKITDYLKKYNSKKLNSLAGYTIEKLGKEVPEKIITRIQKRLGKKIYYLDKPKTRNIIQRFSKTKNKFIKKWNLIISE